MTGSKYLMLASAMGLGAAPANASDLGVNYNGLTRNYDYSELERTGTTWVRAFIDVTRLQALGEAAIATDPDVVGFKQIRAAGFKVILNLKYNYAGSDFPSDVNSQAFIDIRAFTTKVLNQVYDSTDIVVVGNEPFIESDPADRDNDLFLFYRQMSNHVITYNQARRAIPLYVGAFNNLQMASWQTQTTRDLIGYARNTPNVAGIDLHMHTNSVAEMGQAIDWARAELGANKQIISTEFSLKNHFRAHLTDAVSTSFTSQYPAYAGWQVWQYLDHSLQTPRPRPEWVAFLQASSWFMNVRLSLENADILFDQKGLTVATYALRQSQASITATTDPWMLNGIYCNQSCVPNPTTGQAQFNYQWIDSFRARN